MSKPSTGVRRRVLAFKRRMREWKMIGKGVSSTDHPILAHIIPVRRCNLSCTYCNEYDDFSKPVAAAVMKARTGRKIRAWVVPTPDSPTAACVSSNTAKCCGP